MLKVNFYVSFSVKHNGARVSTSNHIRVHCNRFSLILRCLLYAFWPELTFRHRTSCQLTVSCDSRRKAEVKIGLTIQPVLIYVIELNENCLWNTNIT